MKVTFYLKGGNKFKVKMKSLKFKEVRGTKTLERGHALPTQLFKIDQDSIEAITASYSVLDIIKSWFKK